VYAPQLERWLAAYPAERFCVLLAEDLFADPAGVTGRVARFIGLDDRPGVFAGLEPHNQHGYAPIEPGLRAELDAYFRPHNRGLAALAAQHGWLSGVEWPGDGSWPGAARTGTS
jgi:hypothetical protein